MLQMLMKLFMSKESLFKMMTYKITSSKEIEKIVAAVEPACQKHGFALLHSYVYHEVVASKGFPIERKVYIYEVCKANVAALVLTQEPEFAPFMPCRLAIFEDANAISITTQNMQMVIDTLDAKSEIFKETSEVFKSLQTLMAEIG